MNLAVLLLAECGLLLGQGFVRRPARQIGTAMSRPATTERRSSGASAVRVAESSQRWRYKEIEGGIEVCGGLISSSGTLAIPDEIDGFKVRSISGFSSREELFAISLPKDLRQIGEGAFAKCHSLRSVTIPKKVAQIGKRAFESCTGLVEIVVEEGNRNFKTIDGMLFDKDAKTLLVCPGGREVAHVPTSVESIEPNAFSGCPSLKEVEIPATISNIKEIAQGLNGCVKDFRVTQAGRIRVENGLVIDGTAQSVIAGVGVFESATIPAGIVSIADNAFKGCGNLKTIEFPKELRHIGAHAFAGCAQLRQIDFPEGVTNIDEGAFCLCENLESVVMPDGVLEVCEQIFAGCKRLKCVRLGKNTTGVGRYAFSGCRSLDTVSMPSTVTGFALGAFGRCESLSSIEIPASTTLLHDYLFEGCTNLTRVTLPEGLTFICSTAFKGCSALKSLTLPESIKTIQDGALKGCENLSEVCIPDGHVRYSLLNQMLVDKKTSRIMWVPADAVALTISTQRLFTVDGLFAGRKRLKTLIFEGDVPDYVVTNVSHLARLGVLKSGRSSVSLSRFDTSGLIKGCTIVAYSDALGWPTNGMWRGCPLRIVDRKTGAVTIPDSKMIAQDQERRKQTEEQRQAPKLTRGSQTKPVQSSVNHSGRKWIDPQTGVTWWYHVGKERDGHEYACLGSYPGDDALAIDPSTSGDVAIPELIDGKPVERIQSCAFRNCSSLTSILIPQTVTRIECWGDNAFQGCVSLTNIVVHKANTHYRSENGCLIAGNVLCKAACAGRKSITIPADVTIIGMEAFAGCHWLEDVHIHTNVCKIGGLAFRGCEGLKNRHGVKDSGYMVLDGWAVQTDKVVANKLEIVDGVRGIADWSFSTARGMRTDIGSLSLPEGLVEIGTEAFVNCGLKAVKFPKSLRRVGDGAFTPEGIESFHRSGTRRSMPSKSGLSLVTVQSDGASLALPCFVEKVVVSKGVSSLLENGWFRNGEDKASLRSVELPEGLLSIQNRVFAGYLNLQNIELPPTLCEIGNEAFMGCSSVINICIPPRVKAIAERSFKDCSGLESVTVPEGVERIGAEAFAGCGKLKSIVLPKSVREVSMAAFKDCSVLESVTIPEGVERIDAETFAGCRKLKSVVFPKSVRVVSKTAFADCDALVSVVIEPGNQAFRQVGDFVIQRGEILFAACGGKKNILIPEGVKRIDAGFFRGRDDLESVGFPEGLEEIGEEAFKGCASIRQLRIPGSVKKIGSRAFSDCTSLSVELPLHLEALGDCAFQNCSGIRRLRIPASLKRIGWQTFKDCKSLLAVEMEDGVSRVGKGAFAGCSLLANIRIPKSVVEIGDDAFAGCDQLLRKDEMTVVDGCVLKADGMCPSDLVLTEDIRLIADASFKSHREITSIAASRNLKHVGDGAFEGCADLTRIVLPGVEARGAVRAFRRCTKLSEATFFAERAEEWCYFAPKGNGSKGHPYESLTNLVIAEGSEVIGYREFMSCSNLVSLRIPSSVTNIESMAFSMCGRLGQGVVIVNGCVLGVNGAAPDELVLPEGVRLIADSAFQNCSNIVSVALPSSVRHVGALAFAGCSRLERISVAEGNPVFHCSDGLLIKGCEIVCGIARGRVCIPNGVERIGRYAFSSNKEVTSLEIADTVREIGKSAFSGCSKLTSVRCGNGLRSIGEWAFNCCKALETINLPSTLSNMERGAFNGCSSLRAVALPDDLVNVANSLFWGCAALEEVRLPSDATNISGTAFRDCTALRSVSIPPQVRSLGQDAFGGCASLRAVDLQAGVETIGFQAFYGCAFESVLLPEGVRFVRSSAFRNCTNLTTCTLPKSIEQIGGDVFERCDRLKEIRVAHGDAERILSLDADSRSPYALGRRYEAKGDLLVQRPDWRPHPVLTRRPISGGTIRRPGASQSSGNKPVARRTSQGLLGGASSLHARRLQRQQEAKAAAARQDAGKAAQQEAERTEQRKQLLAIQEERKRVHETKAQSAPESKAK